DDSDQLASCVDDWKPVDFVSYHVLGSGFDIRIAIYGVNGLFHDAIDRPLAHIFAHRVSQLEALDDLAGAREPVPGVFWYLEEREQVVFRYDADEVSMSHHRNAAYLVFPKELDTLAHRCVGRHRNDGWIHDV